MYLVVSNPVFADMTAKYASIWEIEGAVDASVGAKRVVHEIGQLDTHLHAINTVRDMRLQLRHSGIDESSNTTVTEADHNRDTSVCEGGAEMLPIDTYVLDIYHADMVANDDGGYSTAWKHWYIYHSIDGYPYYYNTKTHEWFWMYPPVYHKKRTVIKVADEEDKNVSESINSSIPTTMTKTVDTVNDNNGVFIPNEDTHKNCVFINCEDGKVIPW